MTKKISFIDNLKIFLIALVVAHHVAQAYQVGVNDWLVADPDKTVWLSVLISTNATYFMGLFFLISAYFLPSSCAKTSPWVLVKKKLIRLGIPTLLTVLFILPPTFYLGGYVEQYSFVSFLKDWFFTREHFTFGHTWFIMQLLVYSCGYVAIRKYFGSFTKPIVLSHKLILLYTLALFACTGIVSLQYPQNTWCLYHLVEPYHLPQYISLFVIGSIAYEHNWLQTFDRRIGYIWLGIGIFGVVIYAIQNVISEFGFSPLGYLLWSSVMCSAWCVGLLALFRDYVTVDGRIHCFLRDNAYCVYLVHILPLVYIQSLFVPYDFGGMQKFLMVFALSYVASYVVALLLRYMREWILSPISKK